MTYIKKQCSCGHVFKAIPSSHIFHDSGDAFAGVYWNCEKCRSTIMISKEELKTYFKKEAYSEPERLSFIKEYERDDEAAKQLEKEQKETRRLLLLSIAVIWVLLAGSLFSARF